jgi:hypothetical protein
MYRQSLLSFLFYAFPIIPLLSLPLLAEENKLWKVVHRDSGGKLYMQRMAFPNDGRGIAEVWIKEISEDLEYKVQYDCEMKRLRFLQHNPLEPDKLWGEWEQLPKTSQARKLIESACSQDF